MENGSRMFSCTRGRAQSSKISVVISVPLGEDKIVRSTKYGPKDTWSRKVIDWPHRNKDIDQVVGNRAI